MSRTIRVRDWNEHFEISQSRKIVGPLNWVGVKTKHDGKGFRRLMAHPNGPALYGAFHLIVQIAAKCPARGLLSDADGPLTADDLAIKTGCPAEVFSEAIEVLSSKGIAWIELVDAGSSLPEQTTTLPTHNQPTNQTKPTEHDQPTGGSGGEVGRQLNFECLRSIEAKSLKSESELYKLHKSAHAERPSEVPDSVEMFVNFVASAERSLEVNHEHPVKIFRWMIRNLAWSRLETEHKLKAKRRVKEYLAAHGVKESDA